jgi:hypothetical protein
MITCIYPYRGRDLERVQKSLESLKIQTNKAFKVVFVDFGTPQPLAKDIQDLVERFEFTQYIYTYECDKPWNKSRAINIALKTIDTSFTFVADIDMIFAPHFIDTLTNLKTEDKAVYFKVGFLSESESKLYKSFEDYDVKFTSSEGATGLTLFPTKALKAIGGFDEYYHYWGAEDTDAHVRIQNTKVPVIYYDTDILMLHQWHPIYRAGSEADLTTDLRIADIVRLNHAHLSFNTQNTITKVNDQSGRIISKQVYETLLSPDVVIKKRSLKSEIEHIKTELLSFSNTIVSYQITTYRPNLKDKVKHTFKKQKRLAFYSLKETNDLLLKELLIHYRDYDYRFVVAPDLETITFTIAL